MYKYFAEPHYFYLLIIIPLLIAFFILNRYIREKNLKAFGNPLLIKQLMPDVSSYRPYIKFFFLLTAIILTIVLMARPRFGSKKETVKQNGIELMIALDISNSMLATDVAPSRLEKAKQIISRLLDRMGSDKIGLVVFAGDAYVQLPITEDHVSAKMFLSSVSPDLISRQGTAIGAAIDLCVNSFPDTEGVGKAILVITDGENHEGDASASAKAAAEKGFVVHVIGMGSADGVPIPIPGTSSFRKDRNGQIVISALNEKMAQEVAYAGDGIYVRADNTNSALKLITNELEGMETSEVEKTVFSEYNELFQWFAGAILLLLLIEFFLQERKTVLSSKFRIFD